MPALAMAVAGLVPDGYNPLATPMSPASPESFSHTHPLATARTIDCTTKSKAYYFLPLTNPNGCVAKDSVGLGRKPTPKTSNISDKNIEESYQEIIGSAENLVGRVLQEQGLGRYCDPDFVRTTQRELAEAIDMTQEEMDKAAHKILHNEAQTDDHH
ncbi:hypothetical protein LAZ67_17000538 [Cordylochernes scorpioides]|uniref:Voltage-gated calcium channel subunit alpha C-terminal domain-containing protein n=1 Tax=Cordylochernes scorpioides TaxID=51811 RepID=A0ABY6LFE4_9ARAC|nr:hypothetical protein LAZ67_17000538 [Cordylochernes scorpioides]